MFKALSRYIARKPSMDPRVIPLLYRAGTASNRSQLQEQTWLVRLLLAGVRVSNPIPPHTHHESTCIHEHALDALSCGALLKKPGCNVRHN